MAFVDGLVEFQVFCHVNVPINNPRSSFGACFPTNAYKRHLLSHVHHIKKNWTLSSPLDRNLQTGLSSSASVFGWGSGLLMQWGAVVDSRSFQKIWVSVHRFTVVGAVIDFNGVFAVIQPLVMVLPLSSDISCVMNSLRFSIPHIGVALSECCPKPRQCRPSENKDCVLVSFIASFLKRTLPENNSSIYRQLGKRWGLCSKSSGFNPHGRASLPRVAPVGEVHLHEPSGNRVL